MPKAVLLDTCFLIKLLNPADVLHLEALKYYEYFINNKIIIYLSTISVAEYCVRGKFEDIPLRQMRVLPFNWDHAKRAGDFTATVYRQKSLQKTAITNRAVIPNDSKLFAQADVDKQITCFVTSDEEGEKVYRLISSEQNPRFEYWDINIPLSERISEFPFEE
jgi:predicted nucleic acid-binding protein